MPKISIIIVSWNVAESLKNCLKSVFSTNYSNLELIVIDNASTDDSRSIVEKFTQVKLISNVTNIGFPKAVNQGLKNANGELMIILNPDTQIPPDFFTKSLEFFKNFPDAGIVGPRFRNTDGSIQGSVFPEPTISAFIAQFWLRKGPVTEKYTPPGSKPCVVNAISGGCFILPKKTLEQVGLFTEQVFMYYEDLDYCRRVRQAGLKIYFNPEIEILHEHGQSSKQSAHTLKYLRQASRWYNGRVKDFLLWFISYSGQKIHCSF